MHNMVIKTGSSQDEAAIRHLSVRNQEPDWLTEQRIHAIRLAPQLPLPQLEKMKMDRWNIQDYGAHVVNQTIQSIKDAPATIHDLLQEQDECNVIIHRNCGRIYVHLNAELASKGVIFMDLTTAVKEHEHLVKRYLHCIVKPHEHRISAMHCALWNSGIFLYVPKNVNIDVPIQAIFLTDDERATFAPHILIVVEQHSSITYVDNYVSAHTSGAVLHNGVVEVIVKEQATVRYATVHQLGQQTTDITYRKAMIEKGGRMEWMIGEMNDGNTVSHTTSILQGDGSSSNTKAIAVGSGVQKMNYTTEARHFGQHTPSQMTTRAVIREGATAIINGVTKIEKGARKADGQQVEKVLMLSPHARGDANPILLIDEDDVTAGHAASVGQVNEEQIYYLMSRGISRRKAEQLIIYGFLAPVIADVPLSGLRNQLQSLVERKLGQ